MQHNVIASTGEQAEPAVLKPIGQDLTVPMEQKGGRVSHGKRQAMARSTSSTPWRLDLPLLIAERIGRQIYWSWPTLRGWRKQRDRRWPLTIQECTREALRAHLKAIGVTSGALVLLHSRVTGVNIHSGDASPKPNAWETAAHLLSDLIELVGLAGTLAIPTNAKYQTAALEECRPVCEMITYDPSSTPCGVGLVNELFWRKHGVKRSLFPYNMLAAYGPLADELLRDNLNERKPSPHGVDSGYYRFCKLNGLVVSIGVPLRECLTIAHVVEEVRADWKLPDLFTERRYQVVQGGIAREWTVRLTRDEYDKFCHCHLKMGRDLVAEGVIHEGVVGTVRVDWARAGDIYEFFWRKTATRPYPYYGLWMLRKPWRRAS